jgi:hypothetical protein
LLLLLLLVVCRAKHALMDSCQQLRSQVKHASLLLLVCALLQGAGGSGVKQPRTGTKVVVALHLACRTSRSMTRKMM